MTALSDANMPLWFWAVTTFLIAACVGSFLNVVIARVPHGRSIAWPGSHCFTCGAPIAAHHNIPILSWFLLRGRCHDCKSPFSVRYAVIELTFAALCTFAVLRHGGPTHAAFQECVLLGFLLTLSCIDLDTWLLPHVVTIPGVVVGLLFALPLGMDATLNRLFAAAIGYTVLLVGAFIGERVLGKEVMGGGDFVLFALIGAFLGTRALLPVIFLASFQGAVIGITLILKRGASNSSYADEEDGDEAESAEIDECIESLEAIAPDGALAVVTPEPPGQRIEMSLSEPPNLSADVLPQQPDKPIPSSVTAKLPGDGWMPDPHAIPFGPFLALGAAEVAYFSKIPEILFPWIS